MRFDIDIATRLGERDIACRIKSDAPLVALVGPSGAGKTSLLNCIAGIATPSCGHIAIGGRELFNSSRAIDLPAAQRGCGYLFQDNRLFPHLTVRDNLVFAARARPVQQLIDSGELVDLLDLSPLLQRLPRDLSGGEKRRVALARAVNSGPEFLLLDEPLVSLDPDRSEAVLTLVERLRDGGRLPILYVSHDQTEIDRLAGHVVRLAP